MPAAIPILGAVFLGAGAVAATIASVAAITIAGIGLATVLTVTGLALMAVSALTMKTPKPASQQSGQQLDLKLDPKAPVPVVYGRTATGGYMTYRDTWGAKNALIGMVAVLSVGPVQAVEQHIATDYSVTYNTDPTHTVATCVGVDGYNSGSKLYRNKLRMRYQLGETPASLTVTQASGYSLPGSPGKMSGLAHAIQIAEYDQEAFPQGLPRSKWVLRGVKLYDPRKDSTYPGGSGAHCRDNPDTWEFSENPYLAALDWILGRYQNAKKVYGIGAKWAEVDVPAFVYGANIADANGWKIGGAVTSADDKYAVLATILQSGGGLPVPRGAQISVSVNAPKASVFTLTSEDIVDELEVQSTTSWRDRKNTIIPSYREESQLWEVVAGEDVSIPAYIEDDGGEIKSFEIEYTMVQQAAQAHQLAAYELANSREFLTFKARCKPRLLNVRVGDAITVNLPEVGALGQKCVVIGREYDPQSFNVILSLKSETDAKHAFALGQSQVAPATPALSGFDPTQPELPGETAWFITGTYKANNSGVKVPVIVLNGASDNPYATRIIVEYRAVGEGIWTYWTTAAATTTQVEIYGVTAGTSYEIAVSYVTGVGAISERRVMIATAGAMEIDWSSGVITGPTRPADGATVGGTVGEDIKNPDGTIWVPPAIDMTQVEAEIAEQIGFAQAVIDAKLADQAADITDAKTDLAETISDLAEVRGDVADEVALARANEAALNTKIITAQTTADGAVSSLASTTTILANADIALGNRSTVLEAQMAGSTASGLKTRITDEETVRTSQTGALATRANTLEAQLAGTATSNLSTRLSTVETVTTNGTFAAASRATALEAQMAGTQSSGLSTRLGTVETATTDGRFATASRATSLESRATAVENQLAGTATSNLLTRITDEVTTRTSQTGALATRANTMEAQFAGTSGSALLTRLGVVETATTDGRFATASRATNLEARASTVENQLAGTSGSNLLTRIGVVETATTDGRFAAASRASTLEAQLAGSQSSNLLSRISTVETATTDGRFATASSLSSLSSTVGGLSSTVSTQAGTLADLQGRAASYLKLSTVAGNGRAQITLFADANGGGGVDIVGDTTFRGSLNVGPDSGQRCKITNSGMTVYDANNVMRVRVGIW